MKYKHYAPKTKSILIYSKEEDKLIEKINDIIEENKRQVIVICKTKNLDKYNTKHKLGMGNTKEEISKNIFTLLRKADRYETKLIIIEGVDKDDLGLAIMNRLIRACSNNYIEI